jgi:DNA-binding beta-propeller fold protein YncE
MRIRVKPVTFIVVVLVSATAWAGEVSFTAKPAVKKAGDKTLITFTVSQPTDVEVAVLGAEGRVVRHIAAGMLGGRFPPPPPLQAGLAQALPWDGKDDAGKAAAAGPFQVRVRAGTTARLGKIIGFDPYKMPIIRGLATDEKGRLYVHFNPFDGLGGLPEVVRQFDADGKYSKTVFPPPADLKPEQAKGLTLATGPDLDAGYLYPANYYALLPRFFPAPGSDMVMVGHRVTVGKLFFQSLSDGLVVMSIGTDGSIATDPIRGRLLPSWAERTTSKRAYNPNLVGPMTGAVSPDGKTVYLAGRHSTANGLDLWKKGRVHAVDLTAPLTPVSGFNGPAVGLLQMRTLADVEIPAGTPLREQPWSDWGAKMGMAAVHGLDVDPQGNVYACDRANHCIAVYDKAGKPLGRIAVQEPDQVAVHPKTGAVYVLTRTWKDKQSAAVSLLKFADRTSSKELVRFRFPQPAKMAPSLALDSAAEPPGLWVSNIGSPGGLLKMADQGDSFREVLDLASQSGPDALGCVWLSWVNPVTDEVFANDGWAEQQKGLMARYDGKTGKRLPCAFTACDMAFDLDGNVYYSGMDSWTTPVTRLTPELKPLPFPGGKGNKTTGRDVYGKFGHGHCQKGLYVCRDGTLYAFHMKTWSEYTVVRWGPDGKAIEGFLTGSCPSTRAGCLKVDAAGNLYIGMPTYPKSYKLPYSSPEDWFAGSVVKFRPDQESFGAGKQKPAAALDWTQREGAPAWMGGVLNVYPYQAPNGTGKGCTCKEARFDLDLYGRLYIPNVLTYRVTLVDNAGNVIFRAGHYGNADSQGPVPSSPVPAPAVPLGWPMTVGAAPDHGHLYAGDVINSRIVRMDLTYAAEETCQVK